MTQSDSGLPQVDPFFEVTGDREWNACVGIQGSEENYIDGYLEAAIRLAEAVISNRLYSSRDTLAMPILYNGRHGLELSLKFAINRLHRVGVLATAHPADHDILSHWNHLLEAKLGDTVLRNCIQELGPFVTSLASIDDDGEEFRYARTQSGKKSLDRVAVVNLPHILASLKVMRNLLTRFNDRVQAIEDERTTGTYTAECSREDLRQIAEMLGNHETWSESSFTEKKVVICERFGLSSNKFSKAVNKIKNSRELGVIVGLEQALHHLSDDKAVAVLELWAKRHLLKKNEPEDLGSSFFELNADEIFRSMQERRELNEAVQSLLTPDELADLEALFYIGRNREQGEHYEWMLDYTKALHPKSEVADVDPILVKSNLLEHVINGVRLVGRPSLTLRFEAIRARHREEDTLRN